MAIAFRTYRGDTAPVSLSFVDTDGDPYDLTGVSTLTITANPEQNPDDDDDEMWSVAMTITSASGGTATFALSSVEADMEPGVYWFDVEAVLTAGSTKRTIHKNRFQVLQDINK